MSFDYLIRFTDLSGAEFYGNLTKCHGADEIIGLDVDVLDGNIEDGWHPAHYTRKVHKLLCPLPSTPAVLVAGLNYSEHVKETKSILPDYPVIITTTSNRLCGPLSNIEPSPHVQSMLDFEGELAVVLGRDLKDATAEDITPAILGYAVANDVSARDMVSQEAQFGQIGHSKSFDTFGPLGPALVSPERAADVYSLHLTTKVQGELRQSSSTEAMTRRIDEMLVWVSKGRLVPKGTVLLTGTPSGVAWGDGRFLKDGDVVEIEIENIGSIRNQVCFQ